MLDKIFSSFGRGGAPSLLGGVGMGALFGALTGSAGKGALWGLGIEGGAQLLGLGSPTATLFKMLGF